MEMGVFFGLVGTLVGIIIGISAFVRNRDKDIIAEAKQEGAITTQLNIISKGITEIKLEMKEKHNEFNAGLKERDDRLSKVETLATRAHASAKSAHKRLNQHMGLKESDRYDETEE